jgi:hypothetical protein
VDASGSMAEDDKNAVVKYLLNGICNVSEFEDFRDVDFVLYQWGQSVKKFDSIENSKIEFTGRPLSSGVRELSQIIDENKPLIFISDGNFDRKDKESIKKLSKHIVTVFVGIDANRKILRDIATDGVVYSVADFVQVVYETCK